MCVVFYYIFYFAPMDDSSLFCVDAFIELGTQDRDFVEFLVNIAFFLKKYVYIWNYIH